MVIHKTMTMPASCIMCWFGHACDAWIKERCRWKGYSKRLDECPLVDPDRPTDHWNGQYTPYECPACGRYSDDATKYCAHCGTRLERECDD